METEKVFTSGRSQAVRIPKGCRFSVDGVSFNKVGGTLILTPVESLPKLFDEGFRSFSPFVQTEALPEYL